MSTVTIELSEETRRLFEAQAACRGISLSRLVAERVERIAADHREVLAILDRDDGVLDDDEAMALALEEVHKYRSGQ